MLAKHPKGLKVLFLTEMWERFGFYTMLSVLVLYMTHVFGWDEHKMGQIYGLFLGFVYFTPLIGGWIADHILGYRRTIMLGAVTLAVGYSMLAVPNTTALFFYFGLVVIVIGNGLFKANISVLVGNLYPEDSPLKDESYNIFYMGINVGALMAPFAASFMRNTFSFNAAFAIAGAGMVISLITFELGKKYYLLEGAKPSEKPVQEIRLSKKQEKERVVALLTIFAIVIFFWMSFHQSGFALTLFADRSTKQIISPELYQVFNPMFILILTPVIVWFFALLRKRKKEPSTPGKIGIGMFLAGLAFSIMIVASLKGGNLDNGALSPSWLISTYFVMTIAELFLSPMGLSFVSKIAPERMRGTMMGGWFTATAIGNYLSGFIGSFYGTWRHSTFFAVLVLASLFSAFLVLLLLKRLKHATRSKIDKIEDELEAEALV
ncbi:dipeptide and tripeptide permease A [bacterium BMS3Abin05]|nr:dipeptide and tripeptide permease A [bacterium BMS3Abin05]GBE27689.1 dipeptide and tripeptide permease A [bacterium BMS3Bbin03]HDZ12002.1 MFS transporter [Bacteroidota bacterium]